MVTEGFTDPQRPEEFVDDDLLKRWGADWAWLCNEWPRQLRQIGDSVRGFSFCAKPEGWLLTVRVLRDGHQQVVFVCKRDPMGCIETLRRKDRERTLTFFDDRYA